MTASTFKQAMLAAAADTERPCDGSGFIANHRGERSAIPCPGCRRCNSLFAAPTKDGDR